MQSAQSLNSRFHVQQELTTTDHLFLNRLRIVNLVLSDSLALKEQEISQAATSQFNVNQVITAMEVLLIVDKNLALVERIIQNDNQYR